jgi:hypothetical protein
MDIIERAARAIFSCNFALHEQQEVIDRKWFEWPEDRRKAEHQARAVLSALREPDEGMIDVGFAVRDRGLSPAAIWQAMIDQALKG